MPSVKKVAMVCGVQPLDMIAFQEGVDEQLPVGGDFMGPALVEIEVAEPEGVEIGRQRLGVAEIGRVVLRPPDQPAGLDAGEFAAGRGVDLSKSGKQSARGMPVSSPSGL